MRRGLASLIIGLSLVLASLSWAGFTLSRTVLDPGRSERLADQVLENPEVRQALTIRLADALEGQLPSEIPVSRQLVETGAEQALDDPRVEGLIRDGFVQVHKDALAGSSEPVVVDAGALGTAGRDALVLARPELDGFLPPGPRLALELPTTGLSWLGWLKNVVDRFTGLAAMAALVGATTAFVVARDRAPVLRRVAFWGYGAAAFWILVGYGIPWAAGALSPTSAAIATAVSDVFFGAMIGPALMMAAVATALLGMGIVMPSFQRRRGAALLQPRNRPLGPVAAPAVPVSPVASVPPTAAATGSNGAGGGGARNLAVGRAPISQPARPVDNTAPMPLPVMPASAPPVVDHRASDQGRADWGREVGIDISFAGPAQAAPRWEEGVGYIDDDDGAVGSRNGNVGDDDDRADGAGLYRSPTGNAGERGATGRSRP